MMTGLADEAARAVITGADRHGLGRTLFVEAGAGSGKTRALVDRVVGLVGDGIELGRIAAITFTEKAAAELRDRVRRELGRQAVAAPGDPRWRIALEQLDGAAIGTLHAFAQRLLSERPIEAGLPPRVEILDEVASEIAFAARWERLRQGLLDDPCLERTLLLALATGIRLDDLRLLTREFDANWDLLEEKVSWPRDEPPRLFVTQLAGPVDALAALAEDCTDPDDGMVIRLGAFKAFADALRRAPDEYELARIVSEEMPSCKVGNTGRAANWPDLKAVRAEVVAVGERLSNACQEVANACLRRLAVEVRDAVLAGAGERRAAGELAFHDLLVLARGLLRDPAHGGAVREAFRRRYQRLLLDEFQDTDPIQIELAVRIASPDTSPRHWTEMTVEPGTLFFVGDPKQSIYRFRRADIGLFLQAREAFAGPAPLQLTVNFRAAPAVINWVNEVFGNLIHAEGTSQPGYVALQPAPGRTDPAAGPAVAVLGLAPHEDAPNADELRRREAADVAEAILQVVGEGWLVLDGTDDAAQVANAVAAQHQGGERWRPATLGDITVLIPARTSLGALQDALEQCGIPYRAETSSLVYSTPEIRELFAAVRAVADPTDELALVTALRSPLFGCGDDDLATYRLQYGGSWDVSGHLPADLPLEHPVAAAMAFLGDLHRQQAAMSPSELLDRIVRTCRLFELGVAEGRPRDVWRGLRFVIDQAREWSEGQHGTLREYLAWVRLQSSESTRVAETILPETDDDAVRVMTIHGAKGLEFPITIVSGLTSRPGGRRSRVSVLWDTDGPVGLRFGQAVQTPEYEAAQPLDEQMDFHERLRLLYVACTRARDHLVVALHRTQDASAAAPSCTNAQLLALAAGAQHHAVISAPLPPRRMPPPEHDRGPEEASFADITAWESERAAAIDQAERKRTVAATAVPRLVGAGEDPGLAKQARDLELPPWLKGRYGSALGRAVHGVLQTVDLSTGAGLEAAARAQSIAEGIPDQLDEVAARCRAALQAPVVQAAARCPRWRETYVAAPIGDVTLEGYIDLLYRDEGGLVIVDYKTASRLDDLDQRVDAYRLQGAAYATAVTVATGEPVTRCVFVFLTPQLAVERDLADLTEAMAEVRALVATPQAGRLGLPEDPGDPLPA